MADDGPAAAAAADEAQVKFTVKTSKDAKYELSVPLTTTIGDVKQKLSTSEYADIPTDRIRLIYSGRVLKDPDTLASIKIKDGHTVHLVQGAASNARQNPVASSSTTSAASTAASQTPSATQVPTNLATGTGNNPLAGITGARYAGFHGLPGMDMFGPDGGMGAPPNPDDMLRMMDNPMFLSQMTEAMNNPSVIQMMQDSPMLRNNPIAREMLQNPEFRRMLLDPNIIRAQLQLQRSMGGQANAFPAPGATNNTPEDQSRSGDGQGTATSDQANTAGASPFPAGFPFAGLGGAGGAGGAANPFAALFGGGGNPAFGTTPATSPPPSASVGQGTPSQATPSAQNQANPFSLENLQQLMNLDNAARGGAGGGGGAAANPFAGLFNAMGGLPASQPPQPEDNRPPEERYADQLRQLNDMGFYDFDKNVQALRRSGGSVQGAIDSLLNNP